MRHTFVLTLTLTIVTVASPPARALPPSTGKDPEGIAFFEKRIRPLLSEHCYECHSSSSKIKGGARPWTPRLAGWTAAIPAW